MAPGNRKGDVGDGRRDYHPGERQFVRDKRLKDADIDVKTHAGVVSLPGEVSDLNISAEASGAARRVPGVRSVRNDINSKDLTPYPSAAAWRCRRSRKHQSRNRSR